MIEVVVAAAALALAAVPALLFLLNLRHYRPPPTTGAPGKVWPGLSPRSPGIAPRGVEDSTPATPYTPSISVLIPARNEERSIVAAVEAALASRGVDLEVIVLDDHSQDDTALLVSKLAARDRRVRLLSAPPLPPGWCGKQHACAVLAREAVHPLLVFVDADVQLRPDGLARLAGFLESSGADLVSGIPHQETGTFLERLVIPLIHFVLLGFLPMGRMRRSGRPAYAAGCGQLFLARRAAYERMGGHGAIRTTLHDGIKLPRAFRAEGLRTDLCDATDLAQCRMYRSGGELWRGLAKNATEGLGHPATIGPFTVLLLGGQVLPFVLLALGWWLGPLALGLSAGAVALAYQPRLLAAVRFRQSALGALLHPVGVSVLLAIQWYALGRALLGRPVGWKGRNYAERG